MLRFLNVALNFPKEKKKTRYLKQEEIKENKMNINSLTSKLNINSIFTEKTNAANEITNSSVNNNTLFGNETEISDSEPVVMIPEQKQEETPQKKKRTHCTKT